jgi:hypothetical protein
MKIDWRKISACNYCSNYNKEKSYCDKQEKELDIYEELKGCEKILFTGNLKIELYQEIPEDSILRSLSIDHISASNLELKSNLTSKTYGDYFNQTKSIDVSLNLSKSEKQGRTISLERLKEAQKKIQEKKIINQIINRIPKF